MSIARTARSERIRAEAAYKKHCGGCFDCYRQSKGHEARYCDIGWQLLRYVDLMTRQENLLKLPPRDEFIQDALF